MGVSFCIDIQLGFQFTWHKLFGSNQSTCIRMGRTISIDCDIVIISNHVRGVCVTLTVSLFICGVVISVLQISPAATARATTSSRRLTVPALHWHGRTASGQWVAAYTTSRRTAVLHLSLSTWWPKQQAQLKVSTPIN